MDTAQQGLKLTKSSHLGDMSQKGSEDENGAAPKYEPNSFNGLAENLAYRERPQTIGDSVDRHNHRLDEDYYTQPGNLLKTPDACERLIGLVECLDGLEQRPFLTGRIFLCRTASNSPKGRR